MNYVVHKGVLFKTYEGKIVRTGVQPERLVAELRVPLLGGDSKVADQLMMNSGNQDFNLHYTEYLGALPWRGHSAFVVDSIISMEEVHR